MDSYSAEAEGSRDPLEHRPNSGSGYQVQYDSWSTNCGWQSSSPDGLDGNFLSPEVNIHEPGMEDEDYDPVRIKNGTGSCRESAVGNTTDYFETEELDLSKEGMDYENVGVFIKSELHYDSNSDNSHDLADTDPFMEYSQSTGEKLGHGKVRKNAVRNIRVVKSSKITKKTKCKPKANRNSKNAEESAKRVKIEPDSEEEKTKKGPKKDLRCPLCNRAFSLESSIDVHLTSDCPEVSEGLRRKGECPRCCKQLCNERSLIRHMQFSCEFLEEKRAVQPVSCHQCGKVFSSTYSKDVLRRHLRLCGNMADIGQVQCKECARVFTGVYYKDLLRRHMVRCHNESTSSKPTRPMSLKCDLCGTEYTGNYCRDVLRKHMKYSCPALGGPSQLTPTSSSQCQFCGKIFSGIYGKSQGQKHARFCAAQPPEMLLALKSETAECPGCHKVFMGARCKDSLRVHEKRCAASEKRIEGPAMVKCPECLKFFTGSGCEIVLEKHLKLCLLNKDKKYKVLTPEAAQCLKCRRIYRGKYAYSGMLKHWKVCQTLPPPIDLEEIKRDVFICGNELCHECFDSEAAVDEHMVECTKGLELEGVEKNGSGTQSHLGSEEKERDPGGESSSSKLQENSTDGGRRRELVVERHSAMWSGAGDDSVSEQGKIGIESVDFDCSKCGVRCYSEQGLRTHFRTNKCKVLMNLMIDRCESLA